MFFGTVRLKLFHGKSWNSTKMSKIFECPKLFESLNGSPQKIGTVRQRSSTKSWYILSKDFSIPEHFWNTRVLLRNFSVLWDKKDQQNRDTTIIQKNSKPEYFWNTDGFAHENFCRCETKKFDKIVTPLLSKNFWYQNISETQKGSPTVFFGDLVQKKLLRKKVTPPSYP